MHCLTELRWHDMFMSKSNYTETNQLYCHTTKNTAKSQHLLRTYNMTGISTCIVSHDPQRNPKRGYIRVKPKQPCR